MQFAAVLRVYGVQFSRQLFRRRSEVRRPVLGGGLVLFLLASSAAAQNQANWNTTSGNWSNANNWDCTINGVSSHCVPSGGFVVTNIGGDITLDINTGVSYLLGSGGSLTLNNKILVATDPLGIQMTSGIVNLSNSSGINGNLIAQNLQVQSSTIIGNVSTFNASIAGGTLGSLTLANQLTASNSTFGSNSNLTIAQPSSLSNSTIGGMFSIQGGSLTVDNSSTVNATQTFTSTGSITIQGGSTWNQSGTAVFLGVAPGSSSLDVTGTGSTLNLTNATLELGQLGNATVTVEHGGTIAATGSGGNLLIGLGFVFPTDSAMYVNSGATVSANNITVAGGVGTGLLSLSDSSSRVTANGALLVINDGVVNAANQSSLTANSLTIESGGAVTIDSGATLTLSSNTVTLVGSPGIGFLTFQGGGAGSGSGELVIGGGAGSDGSLVITGIGSAWHGDNSVSVGELGAGSVRVLNGGLLETGDDGTGLSGSIGTQSTGTGTVTISGGDWQAGGSLQIGAAGSGSLTLRQSGTVESGNATLALSLGSTGNATVTDAGSKWTVGGDLTVGSGGNGSLTIANGGLVTNNDATIGKMASSNSSVSVAGLGSRWSNSGKLTVGANGTGSLFISGGAVVTDVNATIGDKRGSNGAVTVIGLGSSWQNSGILSVGGDGAASLTIDSGSVIAGGAGIGSTLAPVHVTVTNHGSLTVLGDLSIGGAGTTDVTVENGATLDNDNTATVGGSGGNTSVTVTGAGSAWTIHGTGALTLDDKGSLFVTDGGTVTASTITLLSGSLLTGQDGNIIGSIVNMGGTMTPGDATGVMSITGNYTQTSGSLLFEIDGLGPAQFDQLVISGLANITGGSIDVVFGNGFTPAAGESFDLLSAGLGLLLTGVTFDVIGLPNGLQFIDTIGANGFSLDFAPVSQSTPEPAAGLLLGLGLAAVFVGRLRRGALPSRRYGATIPDLHRHRRERAGARQ